MQEAHAHPHEADACLTVGGLLFIAEASHTEGHLEWVNAEHQADGCPAQESTSLNETLAEIKGSPQ